MKPNILICTVGTSLFYPNLENLKKELIENKLSDEQRPLAESYNHKSWTGVAGELANIPATERICGAEINSIASMVEKQYVSSNCGLFFLHSDTDDGRSIAEVLKRYYQKNGHTPVEAIAVKDLQDKDPKSFRTKGLRNLTREMCKIIRERSASTCAINATGGYKAQIAIGVLLGQALGVPVFYKHEKFSEIIAFPPMPISLDFEVWMRASGMLFDLERNPEPAPASQFEDEWDEKYESLVERIEIDGVDYIELSPTGQIFHETFHERFRSVKDKVLPPEVPNEQKREPRLEQSGWPGEHPEVKRYLEKITDEIPQVVQCSTFYYNLDLPERTRFRVGADGIEGIYSNKTYTVKFRVETSAKTEGQKAAVVAALNVWLTSN